MSREASIAFNLASDKTGKIELLEILANAGWNYVNCGQVRFLSLGDEDLWDWETRKITKAELSEIFRAKEKANETIGISVNWQDTEIEGNILFLHGESIDFMLVFSAIRKEMKDRLKVTDINWYIKSFIPAFVDNDISITDVEWDEWF